MENTAQEKADNVLETVSDEYLRKKKRNNRIIFSVISFVVLALAIVIITLSCVRIDLKPYFISEPTSIMVYINNSWRFTPNDENYEEFYDIYDSSFNSSIMTALFTGKLGAYEIEEGPTQAFYSNASERRGMSDTLKSLLGDNYVHLHYGQEQQLYNADRSIYYSNRNTNEYNLSYVDVYFNISSENVDHELTFYFGAYYGSNTPKIVSITIRANTFALYDYCIDED